MPKRPLSPAEQFDLRQALQLSVLDALMASRRWAPRDLVFQGGTSLHLVHGSPRWSEDLDFLVRSSLPLQSIGESVHRRLQYLPWVPRDLSLSVSRAKEPSNPHSFVVGLGGPEVMGTVRVKVEMWRTPDAALEPLRVAVQPVRLASGPAAGAQALVQVLQPAEIYADKVFALAARRYLKPRDVFDLHWLVAGGHGTGLSVEDMTGRLAIYPNETPDAWLEKAERRKLELARGEEFVFADLTKWLPRNWPLDRHVVSVMILSAQNALAEGVALVRGLTRESEPPSP